MKRLLVIAALSVAALFALHARSGSRRQDPIATERVLHDLARDNARIAYLVDHDGIWLRNQQEGIATFDSGHGRATVTDASWMVSVELERVTEVVCERRFIHVPEPGYVLIDVAFRSGPEDEDGYAPVLLRVSFEQAREESFLQLCDRHHLRKIGDFAR